MIVHVRRQEESDWQGRFLVTEDGLDFTNVTDDVLRAELEQVFAEDPLLTAAYVEIGSAFPYFNAVTMTPVAERLTPKWVIAACRMVLTERGIVTDYADALAQMRAEELGLGNSGS